ncbi:MAG: radical SAM protein [bacterium]
MNTKLHTFVLGKNLPSKICLIIPEASFLLDSRVFMTLGILKIAASLEEAGIGVEVLDLSGISNYTDVVRDYVESRKDIVHFGLTATTPQLPAVKQIVKEIRARQPDAKIILGGPHVTLVSAAYKREVKLSVVDGRAAKAMKGLEALFDTLVAGDGEVSVFAAMAENAPRLIDADELGSSLFLTNDLLTELPFPARHLVDATSYHYTIDGVTAYSLIAQLGCPFACGFCGGRESNMLRKIRTRTTENIIAEMVHMHRTLGCNGFMFYDDEMNVNPGMVGLMDAIAKAQTDLGVEWKLRGFIKSQLFNDKQAAAMYKAGFRWILVGFESGSEEILTAINKKATRSENTRCMEIAKRHGLKVKALMSMGHPGETVETIQATKDWLLEVKPDDFDITIITCYPGTPYYDQAVRAPERGEDVWVYTYPQTGAHLYQFDVDYEETADYYKGDPDGGYKAYVFTDTMSPEQLVTARNDLERDVRLTLGIPFNQSIAAQQYEHSMGQGSSFPERILKQSR